MTAVATARPVEPRLSPRLAAAVRDVCNPHPCLGGRGPDVPAHTILEAQAAIPLQARMCEATTSDAVHRWLLAINAAVANPLPPGGPFEARVGAIFAVVGHLPQAVFTTETQRQAMGTFKFFPSAAEVLDLLQLHAAPLLAKLRALTAIAAGPPERIVEPLSAQMKNAVAAKFRADLARSEGEHRPAVAQVRSTMKSRHLSPEHLAAARRAAGIVFPVRS